MARKVFISFLGISNYANCMYQIDGKVSQPVRFVQEALISHLCNDWTSDDAIFIFTTSQEKSGSPGSRETNWQDNGHKTIYEDIERTGLSSRLEALAQTAELKPRIESVDIPTGLSEDEIWDIYETVYEKIQDNDEIYFDMTHAFRSIPMFSVVLFNHSRFMKGTNLVAVYYGAFEKLGTPSQVRAMPLEKRVAPVINLTDIVVLQDYNQVASELRNFGKVKSINKLISTDENNRLSSTIASLADSITKLEEYITTIDLKSIKKGVFVNSFRNSFNKLQKSRALPKPITNILNELKAQLSEFESRESDKNIEAAINWTIRHDMMMQTYPMAAEYIKMRIAEIFKVFKPKNKDNSYFRELIGSILGASEEEFNARYWKGNAASHAPILNKISSYPIILEVRPLFDKIRKTRNSLAHGKGSVTYEDLKDNLSVIQECIRIVDRYPSLNKSENNFQEPTDNVFINLSNHPYDTWQPLQREAAQEYGEVIDISFPVVDPAISRNDIEGLAKKYMALILEKANGAKTTVHVMGELTFTYVIVGMLKASGITCVASTTERQVIIENGTKTSIFKFVSFRKY